MSFFINITVA